MKNIYICLLISFSLMSAFAQSQGQDRFWYFGVNAGLDFGTNPPTALNNGALSSFEGTASVSDSSGNLLFYSDGSTVWNRNHVPMPFGLGLTGNTSSSQSALIIEDLQVPGRYFLITVGTSVDYSVVEMTLDNGLGDIVPGRKNLRISSNTHEKITAIPGAAGSGIVWIVLFNSGQYYAYRVGGGLVNVISTVTSTVPLSASLTDRRGMLKASPDGSMLINTSASSNNLAVLTFFNKVTGVVSNPIPLSSTTAFTTLYGAEFSPNSNFVYLNGNIGNSGNGCGTTNQREILQFNINGAAGWYSNPVLLGGSTGANSGRGTLQLAPDGKIYFARTCQEWLGAINNPNILGIGADYVDDAISLVSGTASREGLPNMLSSNYFTGSLSTNGQVTIDLNNDGCDSADSPYGNLPFSIQSSNRTINDFNNQNGFFDFILSNGQHTITPNPENPTYWNFSPPSVTVNFPTQTSPQTQDFCVTANGSVQDLEVIVVPLELARPGFEIDYKVIVKNKGNVTTSGAVSLDFEENFMTLASTNPTAGNAPSNRLNWSFTNLQPFQMEEFLFSMTLNTPTQATNPLNGGENLVFTGNVNVSTGIDAMPSDNTMLLNQRVVNSFDPNDKTCLEGETIEPSQVGDYVHYLIRFENTGTASAVNVVVKDVIDTSKFDITTLVPLGGSHDYYTRILEANVVEFIHEDINLDFNDATNDGYVLFKIKTLSTLVIGDTFDNQAQIYFDFNAPITTNNESVLVQSTASIAETTDASISLYPNPANNLLNLTADQAIKQATVIDTTGRLVSSTVFVNRATSQQLDITDLNTGVYFVKVQSELGVKVVKVVKE